MTDLVDLDKTTLRAQLHLINEVSIYHKWSAEAMAGLRPGGHLYRVRLSTILDRTEMDAVDIDIALDGLVYEIWSLSARLRGTGMAASLIWSPPAIQYNQSVSGKASCKDR